MASGQSALENLVTASVSHSFSTEFWANKRVFVTGHTGFKGSWLCHALCNWGSEVTGYALAPATDLSLFNALELKTRMTHLVGDLRDANALQAALLQARPEFIFHLAAQPLVLQSYADPLNTWSVNVQGSANLLAAVNACIDRKVSVIFVTTDKVYQNNNQGKAFVETDPLGGHDPYSASKAACELLVESWRKSFWPDGRSVKNIVSVRSGNVIGGGDWSRHRLVPDLVRAFSLNQSLILRNPKSTRPWQHVLDSLYGYLLVGQQVKEGSYQVSDCYNFGPSVEQELSVSDLVEIATKSWHGEVRLHKANKNSIVEAKRLTLNSGRAFRELGWRPIWDASKSIEKTISWYREFYSGTSARELCNQQLNDFVSALNYGITDE